jgi:hypothetical protein
LRNNGDFQKITAHTMKVMATSLFVLLSQFWLSISYEIEHL